MGKDLILEESLGFLLNRAAILLKSELHRLFKAEGHDVTPEQFGVLLSLWRNDGQTQSELADNLAKDKTNITRILDGMEKRELIVRVKHEHDRRSYRIQLTAKGKKMKQIIMPLARKANAKCVNGLQQSDVDKLRYYLNVLFENLK